MTEKIIEELIDELYIYHKESANHCIRASNLAKELAPLFFNKKDASLIVDVLKLHDYGKKFIPIELLDKQGVLTLEEKNEINKHSLLGAKALSKKGFPEEIVELVKRHHDKNFSSMSNILVFVEMIDIYDALLSPRAYKEPFSMEETIFLIEKHFKNVPFAVEIIEHLKRIKSRDYQ